MYPYLNAVMLSPRIKYSRASLFESDNLAVSDFAAVNLFLKLSIALVSCPYTANSGSTVKINWKSSFFISSVLIVCCSVI
ncbi:hypothetical protein D3C81_1940520 [compost metagenome]